MHRLLCCFPLCLTLAAQPSHTEYQRRVDTVRGTKGFVALWDFVQREDGPAGTGRFAAHQPRQDHPSNLHLDAVNYVRDYWGEGREATYADFPLLGRGPFGQALQFSPYPGSDFRPLLMVPRTRLHNSGIDAKGPNRSVSLIAWVIRESGNHAIAGIWHEGTDLKSTSATVRRVEPGMRQYALFLGLAANNGASAAHVSENGSASFSDRYARNLSVTPELLTTLPAGAPPDAVDQAWSVMAFSFDNRKNTVTSYLNGKATEYWIDQPERHPFFQWPAKGWLQAQLHQQPGTQPGEDPNFPVAQFYQPPESKPLRNELVADRQDERIELHHFAYTRVRVTLGKDDRGRFRRVLRRELTALRANPFWFAHDLYSPPSLETGGPFTIGKVIHTSRSQGFTGYLGGVAVFNRALTPEEMRRLAAVATPNPLRLADLLAKTAH